MTDTTPVPSHTTVGAYLATRLVQLEATHVFGLPGDYNLSLLDEMVTVDGLRWIGSTNELNAAYAADGFARVGRRPAAIVTTYGVGELSALNGIAGSYAEDVPVVHIVGMPSRSSMESGAPLHHTFLDGDFRRFERMSREITALQTVVGPGNAAQEIDRVLRGALEMSKPVYIGVPLDVATATVSAAPLATPLETPGSEPDAVEEFRAALRDRLASRSRLCVLAGPGCTGAVSSTSSPRSPSCPVSRWHRSPVPRRSSTRTTPPASAPTSVPPPSPAPPARSSTPRRCW